MQDGNTGWIISCSFIESGIDPNSAFVGIIEWDKLHGCKPLHKFIL